MGVRDFMAAVDRRIFASPIVEALASFGETTGIAGAFHRKPREISLPGGDIQAITLSFDCHYVDELAQLEHGDDFTIEGEGTFRFLREVIPGGDESGLTIIELGEKLAP